MATLREAVESGRRWRLRGGCWLGPGYLGPGITWTTGDALSDEYQIEPEPKLPCGFVLRRAECCMLDRGHPGAHGEPEPEKPRTWTLEEFALAVGTLLDQHQNRR